MAGDFKSNDHAKQLIRENQAKLCTQPGCDKHRIGLSPLCNTHRQNMKRNGSPTTKAIREVMYRHEREKVARLWALHRQQPAFLAAVKYVETLFYEAEHRWTDTLPGGRKFKYNVPGRGIILTLIRYGITPEELLVYLGGMFVYAAEHELFIIERSLPTLLGLSTIHAAGPGAKDYFKDRPLHRVLGGRYELGCWARDNLLKFFVSQHAALKRYAEVLKRREEILGSFSLDEMSDHEVLAEAIKPLPETTDTGDNSNEQTKDV